MNKKLLLTIGSCSVLAATLAQAQVITAWNFDNLTTATNLSPVASTGVGTATALGMGIYPTPAAGLNTPDVLVGKTTDTGANLIADTSNIWRIRATGGGNGWSTNAPIGTQGAKFAASTVGFTGINVSFDWYVTTQGEANMQLLYTTDGINFNNVALTLGAGSGISVLNNSSSPNTVLGSYVHASGQDWFTGLNATITDPAAANNPLFAVEMVNASQLGDNVAAAGTLLNNTSGNWRFDNVTISGTTVPEPSATALLGLGFGLLGYAARRRQNKSA